MAHDIVVHLISLQKERADFEIIDVIIPNCTKETEALSTFGLKITRIDPKDSETLAKVICNSKSDLVFTFSWSWKIPSSITKSKILLCLHRSRLPNYAGGSPIQNQVFDQNYESKVTVFRMTDEIDLGPLFMQCSIYLFDGINEVFCRLASKGRSISEQIISDLIAGKLHFSKFTEPKLQLRKED